MIPIVIKINGQYNGSARWRKHQSKFYTNKKGRNQQVEQNGQKTQHPIRKNKSNQNNEHPLRDKQEKEIDQLQKQIQQLKQQIQQQQMQNDMVTDAPTTLSVV